jgi:hypothetical protein
MVDELDGDHLAPKVASPQINSALIDIKLGNSSARLEVQMTPAGLLAVGCLVSSILLSVVPIVTAATHHLRRR